MTLMTVSTVCCYEASVQRSTMQRAAIPNFNASFAVLASSICSDLTPRRRMARSDAISFKATSFTSTALRNVAPETGSVQRH